MQLILALLGAITASELPVRVVPSSGTEYEAVLTGVQKDHIILRVVGSERKVPLDSLQLIQRVASSNTIGSPIRVELVDGTIIASENLILKNDKASLTLRGQEKISISVRLLRSLRFKRSTPETDNQWVSISRRKATNDTLVVRRAGKKLDQASGVVLSIADRQVKFDLEGRVLDAPFPRLEGVFFGAAQATDTAPPIQVKSIYGSVWNVAHLGSKLESQQLYLQMTTLSGLTHSIPLKQIQSIRLAGGVQLLATAKPVSTTYSPWIAVPQNVPQIDAWFQPKSDPNGDLIMRSKSRLEYRIDASYQKFVTSVEMDPIVENGGNCDVTIWMDNASVWSKRMSIHDDPSEIQVSVNDAKRIAIEVDYGGDGDIGDVVRLRQPRLIK